MFRGIAYDTIMRPPVIIIDTNVLVAALRSRRGASFRLLDMVGTGRFNIAVSVPLVLEYEAVGRRHQDAAGLSDGDLDAVLDYLCSVADRRRIHYLWRPVLRDAKDDMVLEVAVHAGATFIVTFNVRDFDGLERFGVRALTPREFLNIIGGLP